MVCFKIVVKGSSYSPCPLSLFILLNASVIKTQDMLTDKMLAKKTITLESCQRFCELYSRLFNRSAKASAIIAIPERKIHQALQAVIFVSRLATMSSSFIERPQYLNAYTQWINEIMKT